MKKLLILGAGTAGTMVANRLHQLLDRDEWQITIVDQHETHYYQPGFLFIPFGMYSKNDVVKPKRDFIPAGVELIMSPIELIEPEHNRVKLAEGKRILDYDFLVIATGAQIHPEQTPGLDEHEWRKSIHDFYSIEGALALAKHLRTWQGGRLVVNVVENPIKCPVAPLEFLMLADWFFHEHGIRDRVEMIYATPLPGAFTKPIASRHLGDILEQKGDQGRARVHDRARRPGRQEDRLLRRAGGRIRPAGQRPAEHGRRSGRAARAGRRVELHPGGQAHLPVAQVSQHLRAGRRGRRADFQGRVGGALCRGMLRRELPALHRRPGAAADFRRPRQLLHRIRLRQGPADRLQLRHRAAARAVTRCPAWVPSPCCRKPR